MNLPKLSESIIRAGANPQSYQRGYDLWQDGAISNTAIQDDVLTGECAGTSAPYYVLHIELDEGGICLADCSCLYDYGGHCKHAVALLLAYVHQPQQFVKRKPPAELLADLDRATLLTLLTKLLHDRPALIDWVEAVLSTPSGQAKQGKRKAVDAEVYRRQVRNIVHSHQGGGFTYQLDEVRAMAIKFLDADDADTALAILLALIEEAGDGFDDTDDEDGDFESFFNDLSLPLAEAILMLDLSAIERQQLTDRLKKTDQQLGNYGVDNALDVAFEALALGWERPAANAEGVDVYPAAGPTGGSGYRSGDLIEAKLNVLQRQNRMDEYLALCQAAGRHLRYALKLCELDRVAEAVKFATTHLMTTSEVLQLAQRLRTLNHLADALAIGEHGLQMDGLKRSLAEWLAPIEEAQGRPSQALDAWRAVFNEYPTLAIYKTLQQLAGSQWTALRPDLLAALNKFHDKLPLAQVYLHEEAWSDAIELADQPNAGYAVVETVADAVVQQRPEWVGRVSMKHAERLMVEVKSSNYPIAAAWLKRVKAAYQQLGQGEDWQRYLTHIKEQYKRRPALQAQLRQL